MGKPVSIYLHIAAIIAAIFVGLLFMQFCVNLHSTAMLVLGGSLLLGLPIGVAWIISRINKTLTKEVNINENS